MRKGAKTLSFKDAIDLLRTHIEDEKERVHTFTGWGSIIMGCDIDLSEIHKRLQASSDIRLSGENMRVTGHGICFKQKDKEYLFLETDKIKLQAFYKKRQIKFKE